MIMHRSLVACVVAWTCGLVVGCGGGSSPSSTATAPSTSGSSTATSQSAQPSEAASEEIAAAPVPVPGGWGHFKGKFIYDGAAPQASAVQVTKDQAFCGEFDLVNESLVVNAENKGVANIVINLYLKRGAKAPDVHESYAEVASSAITLDNKNCRFEPHVSVVRTSQTLHVMNSDQVGHNTKIDTLDNPASNLTVPVGGTFDQQFTARERRPAAVSCSIHPWMKGWIVVQDSPYTAVTNKNGEFEISNLPSGTWTFQVWHEVGGNIDEVTMNGKATKWSKGRLEVAINADEATDLGEIKLAPSVFEN